MIAKCAAIFVCVCMCCSWMNWQTGMQSVWRCCMSPRRKSKSFAVKTPPLPAYEGTFPMASTPWWETLSSFMLHHSIVRLTEGYERYRSVPKQLQLGRALVLSPVIMIIKIYCGDLCVQFYNTGVFLCSQDSLAAEIEGTMRRELSVEEDSAFQEQRCNN